VCGAAPARAGEPVSGLMVLAAVVAASVKRGETGQDRPVVRSWGRDRGRGGGGGGGVGLGRRV
jgi:hypothetical protein